MSLVERRRKRAPLPKSLSITVGIHEAEGADLHANAEFAPDGALELPRAALSVAEVGSFHEFGTRSIPQRSFIRAWFDERQPELNELVRSQLRLAFGGRVTAEQAGERIALKAEASVKRRIRDRIAPPLAAETIRRKGSSVPLIDTGQLRAAIRGKVEFVK